MLVRWLAGLSLLLLLVLGSAHHRPGHPTPPGQTTTTVATTTTIATTTTTVATTTTSAPTTTTTLPNLNLTADLVITSDTTLTGHIEGNGFQILIDGANVTMTDLTVNNVNRIMWHNACGVAQLTNVTVSNSGVTSESGAYPLHWHLCGDTTRGTVLNNVAVVNGQHHAFVPHGSNGITFLNSSATNTTKVAFWWDPPGSNTAGDPDERCITVDNKFCSLDNSNDIIVDGMVIDGVIHPRALEPCCVEYHSVSAYVLGAGSGNEIRNSQALNVAGGSNCSGFHWWSKANQNIGGSSWVFDNNTAASPDCHGIRVWQNDFSPHLIQNYTGDGVDHGAYKNVYHYENVDVPYFVGHALGWSMANSHVGTMTMLKHTQLGDPITITDTTIDLFRLADAARNPGTYILNGTNVTCGTIDYADPHPDSAVIIDGQEC